MSDRLLGGREIPSIYDPSRFSANSADYEDKQPESEEVSNPKNRYGDRVLNSWEPRQALRARWGKKHADVAIFQAVCGAETRYS